jgi:hypothetical protein
MKRLDFSETAPIILASKQASKQASKPKLKPELPGFSSRRPVGNFFLPFYSLAASALVLGLSFAPLSGALAQQTIDINGSVGHDVYGNGNAGDAATRRPINLQTAIPSP